ncbi:MAG: AraC family transcriptional regulator [Ruthenibacterium sp.]
MWEISEKTGFADVTHFSRIFKKLTGMSANEYRNSGAVHP